MAEPGALGRLEATDDEHVQKYPLTAGTMPTTPTPVVIGCNWYTDFDQPQPYADGHGGTKYWIGRDGNWGTVRGGHAVCLKPPGIRDNYEWYVYYDQLNEGACVGAASSRMESLVERKRWDFFSLYREAQKIDEWPGENYSGTSVRAAMDFLRDKGPIRVNNGQPSYQHGISANRWAGSIYEIAACLSPTDDGKRILDLGFVDILNSWGTRYPHYVRLSLDGLHRLIFAENGDATVVTDR
jgi:hypothetical protein